MAAVSETPTNFFLSWAILASLSCMTILFPSVFKLPSYSLSSGSGLPLEALTVWWSDDIAEEAQDSHAHLRWSEASNQVIHKNLQPRVLAITRYGRETSPAWLFISRDSREALLRSHKILSVFDHRSVKCQRGLPWGPNLSTILQEGRKTKFETPDPLSTCLRVAEVAPLSPEQPTSNRKIGWMPLHVHQLLRLKKYE